MMGMGFLRLNKLLAKYKWKRREGDESVEEKRGKEERSFSIWLLVIALVFVLLLISELIRTSKYG